MKNTYLLLMFLTFGNLSQGFAASWFVAPNGNDNNSGTLASPYRIF